MKVICMKKEMNELETDSRVKVTLFTPYKANCSLGEVTLRGTHEETKHLIVGWEYELILKQAKVETK